MESYTITWWRDEYGGWKEPGKRRFKPPSAEDKATQCTQKSHKNKSDSSSPTKFTIYHSLYYLDWLNHAGSAWKSHHQLIFYKNRGQSLWKNSQSTEKKTFLMTCFSGKRSVSSHGFVRLSFKFSISSFLVCSIISEILFFEWLVLELIVRWLIPSKYSSKILR